jgi:hypothetical protein
MNNEIDAVMFSDVVLPEKYGIDAWDCEIDGNDPPKQRSLAALLHAAGIVDRDAQRAAVAFALEEGELPAPIVEYLHISGTFSEYESLIREKLLGYHVRDKLQNIRILYDSLTAFPRVAETAVLMGAKLVGGRSEYPERYSARVSALVSDEDGRPVRSGRNPLQEELGNLKTYSVYQAALRLQYIRGMVDPGQGKEAIARIDRTTAELSEAFHHLEQAARKVRGIEENPTNVRAFRLLREIQKGIAQQAASLIASLEQDETLISEPNRSYLRTHPHMPFPLLSFDERGEATAQAIVVRLVCESFAKAGYPSPLHK